MLSKCCLLVILSKCGHYNVVYLTFSDPTIKPGLVYREEVDRVRNNLSEVEKIGFDLVMPVSLKYIIFATTCLLDFPTLTNFMRNNLYSYDEVWMLYIMCQVPSVMSNSVSVWKRSMVPPQPETAADIDTTVPFFSMASGSNCSIHSLCYYRLF